MQVNDDAIVNACTSTEYQVEAKKIIQAELDKLIEKYGKGNQPLLEIMATISELTGVIQSLKGHGDAAHVLGTVLEISCRNVMGNVFKMSGLTKEQTVDMAKDIQAMRTGIREGLSHAAEMHVATAERATATLQ